MNKNKRVIFLTGATGFLGSYLLKIFLENGHKVYVLARSKKEKSAKERIDYVLNFWNDKAKRNNFTVIEGDICKPDLGLDSQTQDLLKKEINEIYHLAAVTNLNWPLEDIRKINVGGTKNVLEFAAGLKNLIKVNHISTAYVYGNHRGVFKERDLDLGQRFNTSYEQSKFEAEKLVHAYRKNGLWVDIFRPPIIIGHSQTGKAFRFRNIYQLLHICSLQLFNALPILNPFVNIIPVDILCGVIYAISINSETKNKTYHPFPDKQIPIAEIIDCGCRLMKLRKPKLINLEDYDMNKLTFVQRLILQNNIMSIEFGSRLDSSYTLGILKKYGFYFPEINNKLLLRVLKYYVDKKILREKANNTLALSALKV